MFKRICLAVTLAVLLGPGAAAQEQRGAMEGVVRDASGAVLPGATVEVTSGAGTVMATTTNETGTYRFPALAPGVYVVNASLSGFTPRSVEGVTCGSGRSRRWTSRSASEASPRAWKLPASRRSST